MIIPDNQGRALENATVFARDSTFQQGRFLEIKVWPT